MGTTSIRVKLENYFALKSIARGNNMYIGELMDVIIADFIKEKFNKSVIAFIEENKNENLIISKKGE